MYIYNHVYIMYIIYIYKYHVFMDTWEFVWCFDQHLFSDLVVLLLWDVSKLG